MSFLSVIIPVLTNLVYITANAVSRPTTPIGAPLSPFAFSSALCGAWSVAILILMIIVLPLSKIIVGTKVGTPATIPPMVIAAFPLVARMVESSLREVNHGVIEASQSMGASTWQIVTKVMLPEALPSLISGGTITVGTILGYGAMAGIIGGGGLGKMAINYGYYNFKFIVMWAAVIGLVILVQIFQSVGTRVAQGCDKRLRNRN